MYAPRSCIRAPTDANGSGKAEGMFISEVQERDSYRPETPQARRPGLPLAARFPRPDLYPKDLMLGGLFPSSHAS